MNSSTARGRSQVLASLREVTLSHLVTQRKRNGFTSLHGNQQQAIALDTNTLILLEDVNQIMYLSVVIHSHSKASNIID